MKRSFLRRPHAIVAPLAASLVLSAGGCLKTDTIARAFNQGALDNSSGDPFHDPSELRREIAVHLLKQELVDGYFGQGRDPAGGAYVATWLARASQHAKDFRDAVVDLCCADGSNIGTLCGERRDGGANTDAAQRARGAFFQTTERWAAQELPKAPICNGATLDTAGASRFADYVRFHAGLERAARAVAPVLVERLLDPPALDDGAARAFSQASAYVAARRWRREMNRHTTGLVVKGGASTGIYSAGAVWVALHLIDACMRDETCGDHGRRDYRIKLISGTSTGAMISTAVDYFNAAKDPNDRTQRIDQLAKWFTCYGVNDLYCVKSRPLYDLADGQTGVIEFQGIGNLLRAAVDCTMLDNTSELLLNTVDFRSGRIWALSDQDPAENRRPSDVVKSAVASAALPLIVQPVGSLPVNYDSKQEGTYLDGGIRSEIPLVPLARRGAERVLLVASAQSVLGETKPLANALEIAARYIDVSTGGVAERDLATANQYIESTRLAEIDACHEVLVRHPEICPASAGCHAEKLCEARFAEVCSAPSPPPPGPQQPPPGMRTYDRIGRMWKLTSIFRDETAVEGLHGYNFDPAELRRLFYAGAEVARVRCLEIAETLGLPVDTPGMRRKITGWCTPDLKSTAELCGPTDPTQHTASGEIAICKDQATGKEDAVDCDNRRAP